MQNLHQVKFENHNSKGFANIKENLTNKTEIQGGKKPQKTEFTQPVWFSGWAYTYEPRGPGQGTMPGL